MKETMEFVDPFLQKPMGSIAMLVCCRVNSALSRYSPLPGAEKNTKSQHEGGATGCFFQCLAGIKICEFLGDQSPVAFATAKCAGPIETHWGFSSATYSQYIYIYIILFNLIFDRRELFDLFLSRHQL